MRGPSQLEHDDEDSAGSGGGRSADTANAGGRSGEAVNGEIFHHRPTDALSPVERSSSSAEHGDGGNDILPNLGASSSSSNVLGDASGERLGIKANAHPTKFWTNNVSIGFKWLILAYLKVP